MGKALSGGDAAPTRKIFAAMIYSAIRSRLPW